MIESAIMGKLMHLKMRIKISEINSPIVLELQYLKRR